MSYSAIKLLRLCAIALTCVTLGAFSSSAYADCKLKITNLKTATFSGHAGNGYEVFDRDQHSELIEFKVERQSGSCSFVVGFSIGNGSSYGGRYLSHGGSQLRYQLYKDVGATQILKDVPAANSDEVLSGTLLAGQTSATFQIYFVIPLLQIVPPSTYLDSIRISVYEGTVQSNQLRDQEQLRLSAFVPATAEFSLGDSVGFDAAYRSACVDFGILVKGVTRDLKMHVRSNAGYRVLIRSSNAGNLKAQDPRDSSLIPYSLSIDGVSVPLDKTGAITALQRYGLTSELGDEHILRFTIGDLSSAGPCDYLDVIQVTLFPAQ